MTDQPKTATAAMMLDMEGQRLERRDRAIAISVGREMVERYFKQDAIEGMGDVREQITRAAEHAAYEAIQKEREQHLHDIEALKAWMQVRATEALLKPPAPFVIPDAQ